MILVQSPLRVSFFGGGTDFPDFYKKEGGCVISTAINKYIYVIVKPRFDDKIRLTYTQAELVDKVDDLQHDIVKAV
jgi:D-glycero-alpha-D-manno-heptose-7-phosphate kinase